MDQNGLTKGLDWTLPFQSFFLFLQKDCAFHMK